MKGLQSDELLVYFLRWDLGSCDLVEHILQSNAYNMLYVYAGLLLNIL